MFIVRMFHRIFCQGSILDFDLREMKEREERDETMRVSHVTLEIIRDETIRSVLVHSGCDSITKQEE